MKWIKRGIIFSVNGINHWMNSHTTPIATLLLEDRIRIYFGTRTKIDDESNFVTNTTFIDVDVNNPNNILYIHNKPLLQLGGFGYFDEFGVMVTEVIKNDTCVVLYYAGWQRLGGGTAKYQVLLGQAISYDNGFSFEKFAKGPVLSLDYFDPISIGNVAVVKDTKEYKLFYTSLIDWNLEGDKPSYGYFINSAHSDDGLHWKKDFHTCIKTIQNKGVATPTVVKYKDKFHMWFGYRDLYNGDGSVGSYKIGYANSVDGKIWENVRLNEDIVLSKEGWDSQMICYPSVQIINNNLYMFYCGNEFGKSGFGYATADLNNL